mmetsp:Transcript_7743/g.29024  ORF Transcript_7743/g.29024 Transcript_7743/m.29024 type:complete len:101 (+) Transcript_7743:34-336(+)
MSPHSTHSPHELSSDLRRSKGGTKRKFDNVSPSTDDERKKKRCVFSAVICGDAEGEAERMKCVLRTVRACNRQHLCAKPLRGAALRLNGPSKPNACFVLV